MGVSVSQKNPFPSEYLLSTLMQLWQQPQGPPLSMNLYRPGAPLASQASLVCSPLQTNLLHVSSSQRMAPSAERVNTSTTRQRTEKVRRCMIWFGKVIKRVAKNLNLILMPKRQDGRLYIRHWENLIDSNLTLPIETSIHFQKTRHLRRIVRVHLFSSVGKLVYHQSGHPSLFTFKPERYLIIESLQIRKVCVYFDSKHKHFIQQLKIFPDTRKFTPSSGKDYAQSGNQDFPRIQQLVHECHRCLVFQRTIHSHLHNGKK